MKKLRIKQDVIVAFGDIESPCPAPALAKCRVVGDEKIVLVPENFFNRRQRPARLVQDIDISYNAKQDIAIFRGATTGRQNRPGNRLTLVKRWFKQAGIVDVGFSKIVQDQTDLARYVTGPMSIKRQLTYKFLIMADGNDGPSGLLWGLLSNSVVIMTKPKFENWLCEGLLIPGVHYIEIRDDFKDLENKVRWGIENPGRCKKIADCATQFALPLMDTGLQLRIQERVIQTYASRIRVLP